MTLVEKAREVYIAASDETLEEDFAKLRAVLKGHEDDQEACAYLEGLSLLWTAFRPGKPIPGSEAAGG